MSEEEKIQNMDKKNRKMEYVLISNNKIASTYWASDEPELPKDEEINKSQDNSHTSKPTGLIIDMKSEFKNKTKEQVLMILIEELRDNEQNYHDASELSKILDGLRISQSTDHDKNKDSSLNINTGLIERN